MVQENISNNFLAALQARLQSQKKAGIANLMLYLHNPAGIADHSKIIDELERAITQITEAEEKLRQLESIFSPQPEESGEE